MELHDTTVKAGQYVIGLQLGINKCASQSGMMVYGTRGYLWDSKSHILSPMDHSTISLKMGTNKCASQMGMTTPGTRQHIYKPKGGTNKCDDSSMSLQMGSMQGANQSGHKLFADILLYIYGEVNIGESCRGEKKKLSSSHLRLSL